MMLRVSTDWDGQRSERNHRAGRVMLGNPAFSGPPVVVRRIQHVMWRRRNWIGENRLSALGMVR